jgi:KDO2-lipid IV(A) lauroyltransferase
MSRLGPRSKRHDRNIAANLKVAFPELTPKAAADLRAKVWRHFGRVTFTYPHLPPLLREPDPKIFEIEGEQHLEDASSLGAFILVSAHLGHWEVTCGHAVARGHRVTGLYTPLPTPWIDRLVLYLRSRGGERLILIPRGPGAARRVIQSLGNGEGVFLIVDQRVDDGELQPFFGVCTPTSTTPARLALKQNCPIIPCRTIVLPGGRYRISYGEPLRPDLSRPGNAEVARITGAINQVFESWIRECPDQWLCTKRRWPKSLPAASTQLHEVGVPALPPAA